VINGRVIVTAGSFRKMPEYVNADQCLKARALPEQRLEGTPGEEPELRAGLPAVKLNDVTQKVAVVPYL